MRLVKEQCEIDAIDDACALGYEMHSVGRDSIIPGIIEQEIVGKMEAVTLSKGWGVSFNGRVQGDDNERSCFGR